MRLDLVSSTTSLPSLTRAFLLPHRPGAMLSLAHKAKASQASILAPGQSLSTLFSGSLVYPSPSAGPTLTLFSRTLPPEAVRSIASTSSCAAPPSAKGNNRRAAAQPSKSASGYVGVPLTPEQQAIKAQIDALKASQDKEAATPEPWVDSRWRTREEYKDLRWGIRESSPLTDEYERGGAERGSVVSREREG